MAGGEREPASSSLAASASQRVQAILEAAEASAEAIRSEAQEEADAIRERARAEVGRASESIDAAARRLEQLQGELGALIASLRTGEGAAEPVVAAPAGAAPEPVAAAPEPVVAAPEPVVAAPEPAAVATEVPDPAEEDVAGVRLIALNMALDGTPRDETARFLAENFSLGDPERLLDDVYASVGH